MVQMIQPKQEPINPALIKFRPFSDWVLVEPIERRSTEGGIALPDGSDPDPPRGRVVKCGQGRQTETGEKIPMPVEVGDEVYMMGASPIQPIELSFCRRKFILVRARDLIGAAT
jgi:co-chaperonin GroES (HSP10)